MKQKDSKMKKYNYLTLILVFSIGNAYAAEMLIENVDFPHAENYELSLWRKGEESTTKVDVPQAGKAGVTVKIPNGIYRTMTFLRKRTAPNAPRVYAACNKESIGEEKYLVVDEKSDTLVMSITNVPKPDCHFVNESEFMKVNPTTK